MLTLCLSWFCNLLFRHSFPTRRSSDLSRTGGARRDVGDHGLRRAGHRRRQRARPRRRTRLRGDRKSTRLNSSHANISYAVFCLKKKKAFLWLVLIPLLNVTLIILTLTV